MDILDDIVDEINIKPNKSKPIFKWVIRISFILIGSAFIVGQLKIKFFNKINEIQKSVDLNHNELIEIKKNMSDGFKDVNIRIDNVYVDGYSAFDEYVKYNKKQLEMIVDYGSTNKFLVKRMLEINVDENSKKIQNALEVSKNKNNKIHFDNSNDVLFMYKKYDNDIKDTIYFVIGANKEYVNLKKNNCKIIGEIVKNVTYPNLFDFYFMKK